MSQDEKEMYSEVIREGITPFDRYVSRGNTREEIDIPNPRKRIDSVIFRAIQHTARDQAPRLFPILGSSGVGKTHTYWAYKTMEEQEVQGKDWTIVYIPSPPAGSRILLHIYTCIIDTIGEESLRQVAKKLVKRWGGESTKKLGLFGGTDIESVIQNGIREYPGIFADIVKCLVIYELDPSRDNLAQSWLLGENLEEEKMDILGVNGIIEDTDQCLVIIKLLCEHLDKVIVLYFDEVENPYRMLGEQAERIFLENIKRLYNEVRNLVIIISILKEIWPRLIHIADQPLLSRMEPERELKKFSMRDTETLYLTAMGKFWDENNLNPPENPFFPLNKSILTDIYNKSDGNPRTLIKLIRLLMDDILYNEDLQSKDTDQSVQTHITSISNKIAESKEEVDYSVEVNPFSVAAGILKSIKYFGENTAKKVDVKPQFQFEYEDKPTHKAVQSLTGLITVGNLKIGLDVPSVKSFDHNGGVAVYYSLKRLTSAL
ncbi:MAG: hypothetical protein GF364_04345, partial [Candidatus Lokiarchaeota archaeon]|nr:hypothetical protein [Candidatus Lokiarchaeota archaeon]